MKHYLKPLLLAVLFVPLSAQAATSIPFTVNMSEAVNVAGCPANCPRIAVDVGGVTRYAAYSAGSGTSTLTFTYDMVAGDVDLDGLTVSSPVDLNGGNITDLNGNAISDLTFTSPNTANVKVNYPSLGMDFVYDADGRYTLNGTVYNDLSSFLTAAGGSFTRASVGTYFDSSGNLQTASSGTPRFDYDPVTHAAKGILLEENRTNYIWNSQMSGAIVGSPGTLPNYWINAVGGGATQTLSVVGQGAINGLNYVDLNLQGTIVPGSWIGIQFDNWVHGIATSGNAPISGSFYLSLVSGNLPLSGGMYIVSQYDASSAYISNLTMKSIPAASVTSTLSPFSGSATTAANSATLLGPRIIWGSLGAPYAYDFTLRIAAPQLEKGSFSTSYIPTTTAAVTRQADSLTIPTGVWYDNAIGSFSFSWNKFGSNNGIVLETKGNSLSTSDRHNVFSGGQKARIQMIPSSTIVQDTGGTHVPFTPNTTTKASFAYKTGDSASSVDNSIPMTSSVNFITPAYTKLNIGMTDNGIYGPPAQTVLNGYIRQFKYYPLRVSNTQLQLLTQ